MSGLILPYQGIVPTIADDAFIAETATIIGDVVIGAGTSIWYGCLARGDVHEIRIGAGTNIQDGTIIHVSGNSFGTYIGDRVTVGHLALIHACVLEDDSFVAMKATVMDGAVVEAGAMVAAGALVTPGKRVKSGQLWGGQPARFMRQLGDEDRAMMAYIAPHYVELGGQYLARQKAGA